MIRFILATIFLMALSLSISQAQEYKYNWLEKDPDKRWILTSKDAELKYNWKKEKAGSDCWQYVPKDHTQQYNWRTNIPKLEDRWQFAPKKIKKYNYE